MSRGFASNHRVVLLAAAILLSFAGIGARLVELQANGPTEMLLAAARARQQITVQQARRGSIIDARGDVLALTEPVWQLGVDPQVAEGADEDKLPELSQLTGVPLAELRSKFRTTERRVEGSPDPNVLRAVPKGNEEAPAAAGDRHGPPALHLTVAAATPGAAEDPETSASGRGKRVAPIRWAKFGDPVGKSTYDQVMALRIKGVYGNLTHQRIYPQGQRAAHLIGYVNAMDEPVTGLEAAFNFYLSGQDGWREGERDGRRQELFQFRTREVSPSNGYDLILSLDSAIQQMVEDELDAIARKFSPAGATIIVSDARTGFILGLGNTPTFDLNHYNLVPASEQGSMRNRAVTDQFDPGSTFKIVAISAALNEGLVTPKTLFDCSLTDIDYGGQRLKFMADDHAFTAPLTVADIISHSSNVGAAQVGLLLGPERLYDYARAFGFGEPTGLGLGGEIDGMLRPPSQWYGADYTRIPAGYGVSVTALQIHEAMGVIASGGLLLKPQIVREIRDGVGGTVHRFDTMAKRRVISQDTARLMAQMLTGVASPEGTAPEAAIPGYQVAGKTGTAQKLIDGHYSNRHYVGSFTGFFPASDPRVVVTVIVNDANVPGGGTAYGRVVAVPSFRRIANQLISYLDIRPVSGLPRANRLLAQQEGLP